MIKELIQTFLSTLQDVAPIVFLIGFFQLFVIKKYIPDLKKVLFGFFLVIIGLTFFLLGLEKALFPLGEIMAEQLSAREFIKTGY